MTLVHIAPTREQARADIEFGLAEFVRYFTEVTTFPMVPEGAADPAEYLMNSGFGSFGTPDDCIHHFERVWLGSDGGFGGVLLFAHNAANWEATKRSYELMARYVHPHFQRQSNSMRRANYDLAASTESRFGARISGRAVKLAGLCVLHDRGKRGRCAKTVPLFVHQGASSPILGNRYRVARLGNIQPDENFAMLLHGSSSCAEDRPALCGQPSFTRSVGRATLPTGRTCGLTTVSTNLRLRRNQPTLQPSP